MFPAIILGGGEATRLRPITNTLPKCLVPVSGKPFLEHQLLQLKQHNISEVFLCLHYRAQQVIDFIKNKNSFGMDIHFLMDGEKPLGTGGAILNNLDKLPEYFFVMYGDSYLQCDFKSVQSFYESAEKRALMTVFENNNQWDKSNISLREEGTIKKYSKIAPTSDMRYIDYGLSILSKKNFEGRVPGSKFDLTEIYENLIQSNELLGFKVSKRFYEIGSHEGLQELNLLLTKG